MHGADDIGGEVACAGLAERAAAVDDDVTVGFVAVELEMPGVGGGDGEGKGEEEGGGLHSGVVGWRLSVGRLVVASVWGLIELSGCVCC